MYSYGYLVALLGLPLIQTSLSIELLHYRIIVFQLIQGFLQFQVLLAQLFGFKVLRVN